MKAVVPSAAYGILERRVRGQRELAAAQKPRARLYAAFRAFVEHPFAWMGGGGFMLTRYRGVRRNDLDFALVAIACKVDRSLSIKTVHREATCDRHVVMGGGLVIAAPTLLLMQVVRGPYATCCCEMSLTPMA